MAASKKKDLLRIEELEKKISKKDQQITELNETIGGYAHKVTFYRGLYDELLGKILAAAGLSTKS